MAEQIAVEASSSHTPKAKAALALALNSWNGAFSSGSGSDILGMELLFILALIILEPDLLLKYSEKQIKCE